MNGVPGEIYLLRGEKSSLIKIGASNTVGSRAGDLKGDYDELLYPLHSILSNSPFHLDGLLKSRYRACGRGPRVNEYAKPSASGRSEWYALNEDDLAELVNVVRCDVQGDGQLITDVGKANVSENLINYLKAEIRRRFRF